MKSHGMANTKIYETWCDMKKRCLNPKKDTYKHYGGRGICIYEPWKSKFEEFYNYVSKLDHFGEHGRTLDRIDGNKNYEPGNVRWATKLEQGRNRSANHVFEIRGRKFSSMMEACDVLKVPFTVVHQRVYKLKWDYEKAFSKPIRVHPKRKSPPASVNGVEYPLQPS